MDKKIKKGAAVKTDGYTRGNILLSPEEARELTRTGMNDAGETHLPPKSRSVDLDPDKVYVVLRARASAQLGYGSRTGGLVAVLDPHTGDTIYVRRNDIYVVA